MFFTAQPGAILMGCGLGSRAVVWACSRIFGVLSGRESRLLFAPRLFAWGRSIRDYTWIVCFTSSITVKKAASLALWPGIGLS